MPDGAQDVEIVNGRAADTKSRLRIHGGSLRTPGFSGNTKKSRADTRLGDGICISAGIWQFLRVVKLIKYDQFEN
jgi:hypothetical protein